MIWTASGEQVRVIGVKDNFNVVVQGVNDKGWSREVSMASLKSDGGMAEINEAIRRARVAKPCECREKKIKANIKVKVKTKPEAAE